MINAANIIVEWDGTIINDYFNIISVDEAPATNTLSYRNEILPNGKTRVVATANTGLQFSVTVSREDSSGKVKSGVEALANKFSNVDNGILKLTDATSGEVYAEWSDACLVDKKFLGAVVDGQGNNITLTWSVVNGL